MPTYDTGTEMDLAERLRLTRRRVDQLLDSGMFYARADGSFDISANAERYRAYRRKDVDWIGEELEPPGWSDRSGPQADASDVEPTEAPEARA